MKASPVACMDQASVVQVQRVLQGSFCSFAELEGNAKAVPALSSSLTAAYGSRCLLSAALTLCRARLAVRAPSAVCCDGAAVLLALAVVADVLAASAGLQYCRMR